MKKITLVLEDTDATTLLGLIGELNPISLSMDDVVSDNGPAPIATRKRRRRTNPLHGTGVGRKAILQLMAGKPVGTTISVASMDIAFKTAGLAPASASPERHRMMKDGLLMRGERGYYIITHKGELAADKEIK